MLNRRLSPPRLTAEFPYVGSHGFGQTAAGGAGGGGHALGAFMSARWSARRDVLWWVALGVYALNRWFLRPLMEGGFWRGHLNDLLLVPVALPVVLHMQAWLGWRPAGLPPQPAETMVHWMVWSLVFEVAGPRWMGRGTSDPWDVLCYGLGAVVAQWWWSRPSWTGEQEEKPGAGPA